jgi:type IV pilus assembly protein PilF
MSKRNLAVLMIAILAGAGCAVQPAAPELQPDLVTTGAETDARMRARIHTELAAGYFELGNLSVALEEINIALRIDSGYSPAYNVAGLIYTALKEDRLAEQNFNQALRINPSDSDAHNNYGWFLCQRGREKEAIRHFMEALRNPLYRTPDRSYVNAGLCSRRIADAVNAENYFQSALKANPNNPQALYNLADMAFARGDNDLSKAYLTRLVHISRPSAEVLWLGVRLGRRLGDRHAEESYALQLRTNFPESREARALLAGKYE